MESKGQFFNYLRPAVGGVASLHAVFSLRFCLRSEEDLVREEQEHLAQIEEQEDALKMREQEDTVLIVQTVSTDNMEVDQKKRQIWMLSRNALHHLTTSGLSTQQ